MSPYRLSEFSLSRECPLVREDLEGWDRLSTGWDLDCLKLPMIALSHSPWNGSVKIGRAIREQSWALRTFGSHSQQYLIGILCSRRVCRCYAPPHHRQNAQLRSTNVCYGVQYHGLSALAAFAFAPRTFFSGVSFFGLPDSRIALARATASCRRSAR